MLMFSLVHMFNILQFINSGVFLMLFLFRTFTKTLSCTMSLLKSETTYKEDTQTYTRNTHMHSPNLLLRLM